MNSKLSHPRGIKEILKKILLTIAYIAAGSIIVMVVLSAYYFFDNPFDDKKFDQQEWTTFSNSKDPINPRGQMFEDIQKNILKEGMNKNKITTLLGEPDFRKTETRFSYILGMWSGARIDYDTLDIEFDENDKLISVNLVQH